MLFQAKHGGKRARPMSTKYINLDIYTLSSLSGECRLMLQRAFPLQCMKGHSCQKF